ncbi:hypothetical protein MUN84_18285 [Hymenobacter sp. 5516J-16]|uniref:Uncharacterized protein n=1 Tax=Hymenobacter sublimis TaxID=2933777 RepID=A0ABY4JEG5_9BACT|nr:MULTISPECIES: hypothetical protein [Hymenobacter]UOQ76469.1 hypothetical protein MUN84_18285 [Hymenobacter sp. 5516J-16]UPL50141.1 hypothetical protein MWH26_04335 [Hymenobacter sublimis]
MKFLLLLWMSQHPFLVETEQGSHQVAAAALQLTHNTKLALATYERSLLEMVARREMTLAHLLAYLQESEQA